ncbi:hypothetical protein AAT19DRAFT_12839 [Rhodotorula toruloides]|uniref:Uncharacterized protein n=1 Tax=Rhodotorula toruloides TaxID=5286 RepID=A0A2T0ACU5_RHOTO|nr:hypothetical protein AAT19DRAFT_12839 [Rhodotorula toruloides]
MLRATHICRLSRSLSPPPRRAFPLTSPFNSLVSRLPTRLVSASGVVKAVEVRQSPARLFHAVCYLTESPAGVKWGKSRTDIAGTDARRSRSTRLARLGGQELRNCCVPSAHSESGCVDFRPGCPFSPLARSRRDGDRASPRNIQLDALD